MPDQTTLTGTQALALLTAVPPDKVSVQELRDVVASMMSGSALDLAALGAALVAGGFVGPP